MRRELGENLRDLEGAGHAEGDAPVRRHPGDVAAVEQDRPRGRRKQAADEVEECGLPGPVRPDDGPQLASRHRERHLTHRNEAAETLGDVANLQDAHVSKTLMFLRRSCF